LTTATAEPVRVAAATGTCPACDYPIFPGAVITKSLGHAWRHLDCTRPQPTRQTRTALLRQPTSPPFTEQHRRPHDTRARVQDGPDG
jgi:hypothetical protein